MGHIYFKQFLFMQ